VAVGVSVMALAALTVAYGVEADAFAAITLWPSWAWAAVGIAPLLFAVRRRGNRPVLVVLLLWGLFLMGFAEESAYPVRALRRRPTTRSAASGRRHRRFRVVTINCHGGEVRSLREARRFAPDLVFIQESPQEKEVAQVAREWYGKESGWAYYGDTSLIARGECTLGPVVAHVVNPFTWAHVRLAAGLELEAVSVHLLPPQLRYDLWHTDTWTSLAALERARRAQLLGLATWIRALPPDTSLVVAGDFNMPAGDGVLRLLHPRLHDAFRECGIGWGNTVINDLPVSRYDQIWLSPRLHSVGTFAVATRHSDHRLVVCDVVVE